MRILQLISSSGMYGAEAVVLNLANNLVADGHECTIGVFSRPHDSSPELFQVAKASGLRATLIPCAGQIDLGVVERIRALVSEERIDVLHSHGYKADVYARFASRNIHVSTISTCHTWHDTGLRDRVYGMVDRFVLRGFDAVIAVSSEVERRLLQAGVSAAKVHRIRNGIDVSFFASPLMEEIKSADELVVGLACRLAQEKGVDVFARMAAKILQQKPKVRFRIAGEGDQRAALEHLLKELNIASHVEVLGRVEDMPGFFSSLDVLISSSRTEGFPMGLLEAMANGLPIVATAVGDVPQIVKHDETGVLVPNGDVDALVEATVSLLRNPEMRNAYGKNAREVAIQEFSAARMTAETLQVYQQAHHLRTESDGRA